MIITVFVTTDSARDHWRAQLLEHSWIQCGQPGELVRLVAAAREVTLPLHTIARVVRTLPYNPHPYLKDEFAAYNLPASLFEWLVTEPVDATLLLLDLESVMVEAVTDETEPGGAMARRWDQWPAGEGLFGLTDSYNSLDSFVVNKDLKPAKIQFPVLIHSSDLRKMAARWLELTGLIHSTIKLPQGKVFDAHKVAYALAAAEYRIPHRTKKLAAASSDRSANAAVLDYSLPVESPAGKIIWDAEIFKPWSSPGAENARKGAGREFLNLLDQYIMLRESGGLLAMLKPRRSHGVREARMPDRMMLEIPGSDDPLQLNSSASAIWQLCDNQRTLADIVEKLRAQYDVPHQVLCADVEQIAVNFRNRGALQLDVVH